MGAEMTITREEGVAINACAILAAYMLGSLARIPHDTLDTSGVRVAIATLDLIGPDLLVSLVNRIQETFPFPVPTTKDDSDVR